MKKPDRITLIKIGYATLTAASVIAAIVCGTSDGGARYAASGFAVLGFVLFHQPFLMRSFERFVREREQDRIIEFLKGKYHLVEKKPGPQQMVDIIHILRKLREEVAVEGAVDELKNIFNLNETPPSE